MKDRSAVIIQHEEIETLGDNFTNVLQDAGFRLIPVQVFQRAPKFDRLDPPQLSEVDLIVSLGGPMSVNDDLPALREEVDYLRTAVVNSTPTPVIGICLGAQLLSRALGGDVKPTGGFQFGLRKIDVTATGAADSVFREVGIPLVPTLHGERFSVPPGGELLAESMMLRRDGGYVRIPMAFRHGFSYGFQFEPQLTIEDLRIWNREMHSDYDLMGDRFDPREEASRHLREFAAYAPFYECQMARMLRALVNKIL